MGASLDGDDGTTRAETDATALFAALAHPRRRHLVAVLSARDGPVDEGALATRIAARERGSRPAAVTDDDQRSVLVTLHHRHLPKLDDTGLVDRDAGEKQVAATGGRRLAGTGLLDPDVDEALFDALAAERRRTVLAVLRERPGGEVVAVESLAAAVAARERSRDDGPAAVLLQLHHRHLPKLDDVGLVAHDADRGTVTYEGHPDLEPGWVVSAADRPAQESPRSTASGQTRDE